MSVRVRFAPSPTGYLHIGGLRTALYNYLYARGEGGAYVVRIEDTDRTRFVDDAEADILESLRWAGLDHDEGPDMEGPYGPYRQSERRARYADAALQLLDGGFAYHAFDTKDDLERMRNRLTEGGVSSPKYNATTRLSMQNSLTLPKDEVSRRLADGQPYVVRLLVPESESISFTDSVRGEVTVLSSELDDQILVKSDGMPTYHLANVVDDHEMRITHVIRGEEWLPSTPKHVLLYRFLAWKAPVMAHLPLILSPAGGKLSKRNADKQGIPVLVKDYIAAGYEPDALVNYLAFLGWNPGTEQEVFTMRELAASFSLDRVGAGGVQFSIDKLRWYNEQHLRSLNDVELAARAAPHVLQTGVDVSAERLQSAVQLMRERIVLARDLADEARYLFHDPATYDSKGVSKRWKADSPSLLSEYASVLQSTDSFDAEAAEACLRELAEKHELGAGRIIHPARIALSGVTFGPGLFELMEYLGRDTCVRRILTAVEHLSGAD